MNLSISSSSSSMSSYVHYDTALATDPRTHDLAGPKSSSALSVSILLCGAEDVVTIDLMATEGERG